MDFIARAGAMIDRAHRIAGLLLICVVVLGVATMCQLARNNQLNNQLMDARVRLPVIVVPGAVAGKYDPRDDDKLISEFTFFLGQTLNTFTPETLSRQYAVLRPFFAPALLTDSAPYFEKKIRDVEADRRSSLFIPDMTTYQVRKYVQNDVEKRDVKVIGSLQTIVAGTPAEVIPLQITFTLEKRLVNPATNPYGFWLSAYNEVILVDANNRPTLRNVDNATPPNNTESTQ
ncbi:MAG: hypothetical protein EBR79_03015 [Proteobacteria bacterium]|nr:hypothetical protein [Pseudomonadota bacterium]NBX85712.1 hypothetical protein [Pseudomonadota bacterium]